MSRRSQRLSKEKFIEDRGSTPQRPSEAVSEAYRASQRKLAIYPEREFIIVYGVLEPYAYVARILTDINGKDWYDSGLFKGAEGVDPITGKEYYRVEVSSKESALFDENNIVAVPIFTSLESPPSGTNEINFIVYNGETYYWTDSNSSPIDHASVARILFGDMMIPYKEISGVWIKEDLQWDYNPPNMLHGYSGDKTPMDREKFHQILSILPDEVPIENIKWNNEWAMKDGEATWATLAQREWWKNSIGEPKGIDPTEYYKHVDEAYEKNKWWDNDPFTEQNYEEEIDEQAIYEEKILKGLEQDERSELYRAIMDAGGIQTREDLREEYRQIPNTFKRRDGLPGDEMAEYLSFYYPELGIQSENDLISAMTDRYRFSAISEPSWEKNKQRDEVDDLFSPDDSFKFDYIYQDPYYEFPTDEDHDLKDTLGLGSPKEGDFIIISDKESIYPYHIVRETNLDPVHHSSHKTYEEAWDRAQKMLAKRPFGVQIWDSVNGDYVQPITIMANRWWKEADRDSIYDPFSPDDKEFEFAPLYDPDTQYESRSDEGRGYIDDPDSSYARPFDYIIAETPKTVHVGYWDRDMKAIILPDNFASMQDALDYINKRKKNTYEGGDERIFYKDYRSEETKILDPGLLITARSNMNWWKKSEVSDLEGDSADERQFTDWVFEETEREHAEDNPADAYSIGLENALQEEIMYYERDDFPSQEIYDAYLAGYRDGAERLLDEEHKNLILEDEYEKEYRKEYEYDDMPEDDPDWMEYMNPEKFHENAEVRNTPKDDINVNHFPVGTKVVMFHDTPGTDELFNIDDHARVGYVKQYDWEDKIEGQVLVSWNDGSEEWVFEGDIIPMRSKEPDPNDFRTETDDLNDLWKNSKKKNWWKQADPRLEENDSGMYNLEMNPGDDQADWTPQNFKVGDEVIHLPTGQEAHIEETLDIDLYSVMLDDGDIVEATPADLKLNDNDHDGDTFMSPEEIERFEEDDPEEQNFEDPSYASTSNYFFDTALDDSGIPIGPGDWVHVYNPDEDKEDYIDFQGIVIEETDQGYHIQFENTTAKFRRDEIELVGRRNDDNEVLSWWRWAAPIRFDQEKGELGPEDEGFAVPWGATQQDDGTWKPTTPDRAKDPPKSNPNKLQTTASPTMSKDDWERYKRVYGMDERTLVDNIKRAYYSATNEQWQSGSVWYDTTQEAAQKVVNEVGHLTGISLAQVVALQSVISPKLDWEKNERYPSLMVKQYMLDGVTDPTKWRDSKLDEKTGLPLKMSLTGQKRRFSMRIMDGEPIEEIFPGPKTQRFLANIMGNRDEATVDVWALRVALGHTYPRSTVYSPSLHDYVAYYGPSNSIYEIFNGAYKQAAAELSEEEGEPIDVSQVQAITWVVYKELGKSDEAVDIPIDEVEKIQASKRAAEEERGMVPEYGIGRSNVNAWWKSAMQFQIGDKVRLLTGSNYLFVEPGEIGYINNKLTKDNKYQVTLENSGINVIRSGDELELADGGEVLDFPNREREDQVGISKDNPITDLNSWRNKNAWWTGGSINSVNEAMHSIIETMGYLEGKNDAVVNYLREALSNLEHDSTLEAWWKNAAQKARVINHPQFWAWNGKTGYIVDYTDTPSQYDSSFEDDGNFYFVLDGAINGPYRDLHILAPENIEILEPDNIGGQGLMNATDWLLSEDNPENNWKELPSRSEEEKAIDPDTLEELFKNSWWKGALRIDENGNFIVDDLEEADWAAALEREFTGEELHEPSPYEMVDQLENPINYQQEAETEWFSELYDEGVNDARIGKEPRSPREFDDEEEYNMYMTGYQAYQDFPKHSWWKKEVRELNRLEKFHYLRKSFEKSSKILVLGYDMDLQMQIMAVVQEYTDELMAPGGGDIEKRKQLAAQLKTLEDQREGLNVPQRQLDLAVASWWKSAAGLSDTADWMIEQVGAGVLDYDEAHQEINDMILTLDDQKEIFELRSRLLLLEKMEKNPMPSQGVTPDLTYTQTTEQELEDQPLPRAAWWKG